MCLESFLIYGKVGHMFVAWNCCPYIIHGGVTLMVVVSCMMGYFNLYFVSPFMFCLVDPKEDSGERFLLVGDLKLGKLTPPLVRDFNLS